MSDISESPDQPEPGETAGEQSIDQTEQAAPTPEPQQAPAASDKAPAANDKKWYVVHAYSGFEKNVQRALKERVELSSLGDSFGDILVPTEEVVEMRGGQKRRSERKFFPGYVLVEMELDDDTWHLVKETPRVMGFIGGKADQPAPLTDKEAAAILDRVAAGSEKATPKTVFEPGEIVRVIDGPFNDFNGVVEEVNYEKNRLNVAVTIFGRSTPVELDFGQVEKG